MIITKLTGGLGNQMFEYAFARHLAILNKSELKLDISGYEVDKLRAYSMNCFSIEENFATKKEIERLANPVGTIRKIKKRKWDFKKFFKGSGGYKKSHIYDGSIYSFEPSLLKKKGDFYVDGYFQAYKYFDGIEEVIKKDFKFKDQLEGRNKELADKIMSCNSISVHVRRTDYVTTKFFYDMLGVCSVDYYNKCFEMICSKVVSPSFFIFSDEIEWAKENLKLNHPVEFISHNKSKPEEDMRLMSKCKHNIIANSTFSWWGAWLNTNKDKIVCVPSVWATSSKKHYGMENLISEEWIKM